MTNENCRKIAMAATAAAGLAMALSLSRRGKRRSLSSPCTSRDTSALDGPTPAYRAEENGAAVVARGNSTGPGFPVWATHEVVRLRCGRASLRVLVERRGPNSVALARCTASTWPPLLP